MKIPNSIGRVTTIVLVLAMYMLVNVFLTNWISNANVEPLVFLITQYNSDTHDARIFHTYADHESVFVLLDPSPGVLGGRCWGYASEPQQTYHPLQILCCWA